MRHHLSKGFLAVYRWAAIAGLYSLLILVVGYFVGLGFYYESKTWIAPLIISPSNKDILAMSETLVTTQQTIEGLSLQREQQTTLMHEMQQQNAMLKVLDGQLSNAIVKERNASKVNGRDLDTLTQEKRDAIQSSEGDVGRATEMAKTIDKELNSGLISKTDAAKEIANIDQIIMGHTDAKIAEVLLRDNVREKTTTDVNTMDILAKKAELDTQIATFTTGALNSQQQIITNDSQIKQLKQAVEVAKHSSAYRAMESKYAVHFAFVRYESEYSATVNAPIYKCLVGPLGCHEVGHIQRIFTDEETAQNPVFKTPMRGFLVELSLTEERAAKSTVLFIGRPLWIL